MNPRLFLKFATVGVILLISAVLALGQAGRGIARLGGSVRDHEGKPVPGAKVTIVFEKPGGTAFETTTDKKGDWAILGIGTGNWLITVNATGYKPVTVTAYVRQLDKNPKVAITIEKPAAGSGAVRDETAFRALEEGNAFFKDGQYDNALALYEDFLAKNPEAYPVLLNIGDCYREKGEYDKAIERYNRLIEKSPTDTATGKSVGAKGLAAIGSCYLKQGRLLEAQDYFKKSIDMAPEDEVLPYNVAEICFSNQQIDDAIRYFELASKIKPDWPSPYLRVAYAYLNKGDNTKAAENLEKFIKLEPGTERTAQAKAVLDAIKK